MLYLGADHRGYQLKEELKAYLKEKNILFEDLGNRSYDENDDYPDFAQKVAEKISHEPENLGLLICGSGLGMTTVANKFKNVRAALCFSSFLAEKARNDNWSNILCLAADLTDTQTAKRILDAWLKTPFGQDLKYQRRQDKIKNIENNNFK